MLSKIKKSSLFFDSIKIEWRRSAPQRVPTQQKTKDKKQKEEMAYHVYLDERNMKAEARHSIGFLQEAIEDSFEHMWKLDRAMDEYLWIMGARKASQLRAKDRPKYDDLFTCREKTLALYNQDIAEMDHRIAMRKVLKKLPAYQPKSVEQLFQSLDSCVTRAQKLVVMDIFNAPERSLSDDEREVLQNIVWYFDIYPENERTEGTAEKELVKYFMWRHDNVIPASMRHLLMHVEEAATAGDALKAARKMAVDLLTDLKEREDASEEKKFVSTLIYC